jgi:DNA-binding transcriptional MerR regulator
MENSQNLIQELRDLGFNEDQIKEVLHIGEQEIVDLVLEDFAFNAPEATVQEYVDKVTKAKGNTEQFAHLINEIMGIQYGAENVVSKKEAMLSDYLTNIINLTKQTKEVYQKYSQGDPQTVQAVENAKTSPTVQNLAKKIDES